MRLRFDQLGKQIGQEALGPSGPTIAHDEISPDAQHADLRHEPDPTREAERARLGLLGRLASTPCLIEIYSHAPDEDEVLACVGKLIAFRQKRARRFRQAQARAARGAKRADPLVEPFLWIIAAGRSSAVLAELSAVSAPGWPAGVYVGPRLLRVGIVVASELPHERDTLLVRLMAAGPLLKQAIREGRTEGRAEEAARAVLAVLRARGIAVPDAARERILAQKDPERLERWLEKAAVAASVAEVFGDPS